MLSTALIRLFRNLVYLAAIICFVILVVTGFGPVVISGEHLSGYLLMAHVSISPVFCLCLAVLAVMWADNCRFGKNDWSNLKRAGTEKRGKSCPSQKIAFWLILLLALPLILSILLSMFKFFGTDGQEFLLSIHRYSALLFSLIAVVHSFLLLRIKLNK